MPKAVSFRCESLEEAELIRVALYTYKVAVLRPSGADLRNFAPANEEGAGFGFDAVENAARQMGRGTITHMSRRMADAMNKAVRVWGEVCPEDRGRAVARNLGARLTAAIEGAETCEDS